MIPSSVDAAAPAAPADDESAEVFQSAAELFRLLSTPIRLRIISALCGTEKNVSQLLAEIDTTQPNMSQHLATLYRAGVLSRRRDATQIYYRIGSERAASLCRAVCTQIALEMDPQTEIADTDRLAPHPGRG
ncbi:MAG: metalloregulator ArsR/SmtB family transcription factor [Rubrivivax sp.]|jgi:ArsR family transcriptional regulator|nr:metalloregulator ArsR/SmtB family transcription factor [Rubrivivax sp.]